jgi:hypothetical protein
MRIFMIPLPVRQTMLPLRASCALGPSKPGLGGSGLRRTSDGPCKGQTVSLRQVTRLVPAKTGGAWQIHALTSRTDLPAGEVCWRLTSRWREENYFRYARTHFALDAAPDDPDRMVPNPGKKTAAPDMVRMDAETKQITHAIRMTAYSAETTLGRALAGHYARAADEAHALIREALPTSGDIIPGHGELLIRLDPLTAPRRTQALAALCD